VDGLGDLSAQGGRWRWRRPATLQRRRHWPARYTPAASAWPPNGSSLRAAGRGLTGWLGAGDAARPLDRAGIGLTIRLAIGNKNTHGTDESSNFTLMRRAVAGTVCWDSLLHCRRAIGDAEIGGTCSCTAAVFVLLDFVLLDFCSADTLLRRPFGRAFWLRLSPGTHSQRVVVLLRRSRSAVAAQRSCRRAVVSQLSVGDASLHHVQCWVASTSTVTRQLLGDSNRWRRGDELAAGRRSTG
jgi:hypothetical protein